MKRFMITFAAMLLVTACQDTTSPTKSSAVLPKSDNADATGTGQLWAVVDAGTLVRGNRVTGVSYLGTGQYEVTFDKNVAACAFVATTVHNGTQARQAYTASGHLSAKGVYVEIKNQGGGLTDGTVDLFVACGPLGTRFAVVGYTANLVRSTPSTSLSYLGAGQYHVTFAKPVAGCAYLATVADPTNALVYNPSGVYTGSGPDAYTVYIETKNPGGGLQEGVPFQLAVICRATTNTQFAVVKASGASARTSIGTASSRLSTGNYVVSGSVDVSACAAIATRGSFNTAVPYTPATVEIEDGPNSLGFGVQVRKLLGLGGQLVNQQFHAATIC